MNLGYIMPIRLRIGPFRCYKLTLYYAMIFLYNQRPFLLRITWQSHISRLFERRSPLQPRQI